MAYAIVINLDYETYPADTCQFLWAEIKEHMAGAGFHNDGRSFVIDLEAKAACDLARTVIDGLESHLDYHDKHLHKYMKEFYGFPAEARTNLLLPPIEGIEVQDIKDRRKKQR